MRAAAIACLGLLLGGAGLLKFDMLDEGHLRVGDVPIVIAIVENRLS